MITYGDFMVIVEPWQLYTISVQDLPLTTTFYHMHKQNNYCSNAEKECYIEYLPQ